MLKQEDGFTLIEMLIVLMIISVLILLIIPNLSGKTQSVHDKGCDALKMVVQSQVDAYALDKGKLPDTINDLVDEYLEESQTKCQKGGVEVELKLNSNGKVVE